MTHFAKLSAESKKIVRYLSNDLRGKGNSSDANKQLMVSLYSTMPFANVKAQEILSKYQIPLNEMLTLEKLSLLQKEYKSVISYCFQRTDPNQNGTIYSGAGMQHLPVSIVELCMKMAGNTTGSSVYLPFAGEGAFAVHCGDANVCGFEGDSESWAISQILSSCSISSSSEIALRNPFEEDADVHADTEAYGFVFSFPPILNGKEEKKVANFFYRIITKQLNMQGELYAVLPLSFCTDSVWFDVRKILWDYQRQYSAVVIALPPMLQPASHEPVCIVNFIKDGKNSVKLVDVSGDEFLDRKDVAETGKCFLNVQSILETINNEKDEKHVCVRKASDLKTFVDLRPSRYIMEQSIPEKINGHKTVPLEDLIELISLRKNTETNYTPHLLRMKDLSFKHLNCDVCYDSLPVKEERNSRVLSEDALLTGFTGGKFKVGRITGLSASKAVSLVNDIRAFRIISDQVTEDSLLRSLLSEFVEKQAKVLSYGVNVTRLETRDLLSIRIEVPAIEEQDRICKEDTRKKLSESDKKILESFEDFRKDMHMKKHAIGQTIFNLNNWWKSLQQAREEGNGDVKDTATVGKNRIVSVSEIYKNLEESIKKLQLQISTLDRGNGLEIKTFALTTFIEDYISRNKSPLFQFIYDSSSHHSEEIRDYYFDEKTEKFYGGDNVIIEAGTPIENVDFAPEALTIILDNIVSNACSHGFEGRETCSNIIKIDLSTEGSQCILSVSNNGKPLHPQIRPEDVFTYSLTSNKDNGHFGIGGYEVKKLMEEFGGDAEFLTEPESEFPVTYRLIFHNTNILNF